MGIVDTGVRIGLEDNASTTAKKIADNVAGIANEADKLNSALDPKQIEDYIAKLKELEGIGGSGPGGGIGGGAGGGGGGGLGGFNAGVSGLRGTVASAAAGDAGGAGLGLLAGIARLFGPAGLALGAAVGVGALAHQGAKAYNARGLATMSVAGKTRGFTEDYEGNTAIIDENMKAISQSVKRFGKTYEEGVAARDAYLSAGGSGGIDAGEYLKYSAITQASSSLLAGGAGSMSRYGEEGLLEQAYRSRTSQKLMVGQFEEVVESVMTLFQQGLTKGVVKSAQDLAYTQAFFGELGDTWKGSQGSQIISSMSERMSQATGLNSGADKWLYMGSLREMERLGLDTSSLGEVQRFMEKGITPGVITSVYEVMKERGTTEEGGLLLLQEIFSSLSATRSKELWDMLVSGDGLSMSKFMAETDNAVDFGAGAGTSQITATGTISEAIKQFTARAGKVPSAAEVGALNNLYGLSTGNFGEEVDLIGIISALSPSLSDEGVNRLSKEYANRFDDHIGPISISGAGGPGQKKKEDILRIVDMLYEELGLPTTEGTRSFTTEATRTAKFMDGTKDTRLITDDEMKGFLGEFGKLATEIGTLNESVKTLTTEFKTPGYLTWTQNTPVDTSRTEAGR